ncbi:MFS transporter [Aquirhabdus parva]|uniref:MFS transporter n=1 Tax=Aquirhabdus parva TaxID=2283318 RepID=A0A345P805_9GAMM|nr:MFS transporter [Aquirhabdus parva]AXI03414.1 MFS transporter [Aquirhabdus parva]
MKVVDGVPTVSNTHKGIHFQILGVVCTAHFINDILQSLLLAIYPVLKGTFHLSFAQMGWLTLIHQMTTSLLQPLVGIYTDKHPKQYAMAFGLAITIIGIYVLSTATSYGLLIIAAVLMAMGSSILHPIAAHASSLASGKRQGLAHSVFQVGGNIGTAIGPLLAAAIIVSHGQFSLIWFGLIAVLIIPLLLKAGSWYKETLLLNTAKTPDINKVSGLPKRSVQIGLFILVLMIFSKFFYISSFTSYYTFYLMAKFQIPVALSQVYLFAFLFAVAIGILCGGPLGDKIGRKNLICLSILGAGPFTLMLPYASLFWTGILSVIIGFTISCAFPTIIAFAQELIPNKTGAVLGVMYGLAFGMGGVSAALLGELADHCGIIYVYSLCSFLPILGLFALRLPNLKKSTI